MAPKKRKGLIKEKGKRGPYRSYIDKNSAEGVPRSTEYKLRKRFKNDDVASASTSASSPSASTMQPKVTLFPKVNESLSSNPVQNEVLENSSVSPEPHEGIAYLSTEEAVPSTSQPVQNKDCGNVAEVNYNEDDFTLYLDVGLEDESTVSTLVDGSAVGPTVDESDNDEEDLYSEEENFILHLDSQDDVPAIVSTEDQHPSNSNEDCGSSDSDESSEEEKLAVAPQNYHTVKEKITLLLLLATKKRHKLSYTAAEDIMNLHGVLSADEELPFAPSRKVMKKVIEDFSIDLEEHHVCPKGHYIGIVTVPTFECSKCEIVCNTKSNKEKGNIFLYLPVEQQIKALLELTLKETDVIDIKDREKIIETNFEDIFDGRRYKDLIKKTAGAVLTMNFFVDGLQVATTSKNSAWPILCTINELPVYLRRKHIIMASVWLGKKKPVCNEYLKPFVKECKSLATRGVSYRVDGKLHTILVKCLQCISDSIARPMLRNSKQFNGKWGCGLCYHPGKSVKIGRGSCRSYASDNNKYDMRTHEDTMRLAERAEINPSKKGIKGIKGKSILADIPDFDIARGLDLDSFHALVNVAKRFASLWFDEKFSSKPFNVRDKFEEVNKRYLAITPTSEVSRAPRSLTETSDFRGHEWYFWITMFSVPCLQSILPSKYLNHWCKLVHGVVLLMQNSVAKSEVIYAGRYLQEFVDAIPKLYGAEHVTFSCHLLTHFKESVMDYAQLWTHSAFLYEGFNCEIKECIHSSNGVIHQVCKNMQLRIALYALKYDVGSSLGMKEKKYLEKLECGPLTEPDFVLKSDAFFGPLHQKIPNEFIGALRRLKINPKCITLYECCKMSHVMYHSTKYTRVKRQNNTIVLLKDGLHFVIDSFVVESSEKSYALGRYIHNSSFKLSTVQLPHMSVLEAVPDPIMRCIPLSDIESKVISFIVEISDTLSVRIACINVLRSEMLC